MKEKEEEGARELNDQLHNYFDGEIGDSATESEIKRAIKLNPELQAENQTLGALRDRLRELPQPAAPSYLRGRVISTIREASGGERGSRRSIYRQPMAWAAAAVLILTLGANVIDRGDVASAGNPLEEFVASHVALVQSEKAGIKVDDPQQLEAWLGERLDFAMDLPEWSWAKPVSAEVSVVEGARAARIRYELASNEELSLFVHAASPERKMESLGATSPERAIIQDVLGYKVACWGEQGLEYVLVAASEDASVLRKLGRKG